MIGVRTISSRATYRKRKAFVVVEDTPPTLSSVPAIAATLTTNPATSESGLFALVGNTVTASYGTWDDPDGAVTVVGQWVDADNNPVAAEDEVELVIPASSPGDFFVWREVATQGGVSVTYFHTEIVTVVAAPDVPYQDIRYTIQGDYTPGETLTAAYGEWITQALPLTITGEWYKNGVATGVTTLTYSDTISGDYLVFHETATDALNQSASTLDIAGYGDYRFYVGDAPELIGPQTLSEAEALFVGKTPGDDQDLWLNYNANVAATGAYLADGPPLERNPDFFAPELVRQLTGVYAWKGVWGQFMSWTAITPRHVLACAHGSMGRTPVWFVSPDGEVHKNQVIRQANDYGLWNGVIKPSDVPTQECESDIMIGLLETELPEWVWKLPIMEMDGSAYARLTTSGPFAAFYVSQGDGTAARFPTTPALWTPRGQKFCLAYSSGLNPSYSGFTRGVAIGDSGHPIFFLYRGYLHLVGNWGGQIVNRVDYINNLIGRVDTSYNINTGYTVNKSSSIWAETQGALTADGSVIELGDGSILTRDF